MTGRLLLVCRLLVRDLRRRSTETVLLLVAITAATATMTLGLTLNELVTRPYEQTRSATAAPDLVLEPGHPGQDALDELTSLTDRPGIIDHSGPFPLAFKTLTARDLNVRVVVEGRDEAPATVDQPAMTAGSWVRPGGVVVEQAFADALQVRTGDPVAIDGHRLRVTGVAVTAARSVYPLAGWHLPGDPRGEGSGLVWVDRADIATLAGDQQLSYTLNLKLADPSAGITAVDPSHDEHKDPRFRGWRFATGAQIADVNGKQNAAAQASLLIGSWLLTILAVAGVAGIVAGRVIGQRRRVGLLKAVGAGPAMVAVGPGASSTWGSTLGLRRPRGGARW